MGKGASSKHDGPVPVSQALGEFREFLERYQDHGLALEPESVQQLAGMFASFASRCEALETAAAEAEAQEKRRFWDDVVRELRRKDSNVTLFPVVHRPRPRPTDPTPPRAA